VPELQLERATGFGEDKFTTVEGLLEDIRNKVLSAFFLVFPTW
jgi:C4-type Zn-finger protein